MTSVVLGVAGGIAAYKACEVLRRLKESGHDVTVVPTRAALGFVGATTWEALSGHPVSAEVDTDAARVPHVALGRAADLVLVAPATADLMARAASGRADDLLTNTLLTAGCPVLFAPAMHTEMWEHPATRANVATLRKRGAVVLDPDVGRLTGADSGPGRLPDPAEIAAVASMLLTAPDLAPRLAAQDLAGTTVVVSAGGTREALDPVRWVGNVSSGRMGLSLARAARARGARVRLVAASVELASPPDVDRVDVVTTAELDTAVREAAEGADAVIMAAAVADFTSAGAGSKIKKDGSGTLTLALTETTDVLADLVARRDAAGGGAIIVGFAAETASGNDLLDLGRAKLARKGCDLLVVNDVSGGAVFGADETTVHLLAREQAEPLGTHTASKDVVAHRIVDAIGARLRVR